MEGSRVPWGYWPLGSWNWEFQIGQPKVGQGTGLFLADSIGRFNWGFPTLEIFPNPARQGIIWAAGQGGPPQGRLAATAINATLCSPGLNFPSKARFHVTKENLIARSWGLVWHLRLGSQGPEATGVVDFSPIGPGFRRAMKRIHPSPGPNSPPPLLPPGSRLLVNSPVVIQRRGGFSLTGRPCSRPGRDFFTPICLSRRGKLVSFGVKLVPGAPKFWGDRV